MSLFSKMFLEDAYGVAIREINSHQKMFRAKYPTIFKWYADPFPCHTKEGDYLFVELMDYHIVYGQIAVAPIKDGHVGKFKVIISEPFHMSFPNVFKWNDTWYMLPETYQSKEVRLYRCDKFPYKWSLHKVLLDNVELVDHALYLNNNKITVISYDISDLNNKYSRVFEIDLNQMVMNEIFPKGNICQDRGAGTIYEIDNCYYRAIQDCTNCYGDFLRFYKISTLSRDTINETEIMRKYASDVTLDKNRGIRHIHTYNRNERYEVIDFLYRKFYPNKIFLRLWQNVIRKNRKHK